MPKKIRTIRPCRRHRTKDCVGAHGNHLRNNTLQRHDKKAVRRRRFHGTILPSMSCMVHLLRRPHVRLDASGGRQGESKTRGKESARERKRRDGGMMKGAKGGKEGESYPRRSSGLKETINVPRTQWRTNGPLSGSVRAASVPAASLSVSSPPLDKIFSPSASRLACTKGA